MFWTMHQIDQLFAEPSNDLCPPLGPVLPLIRGIAARADGDERLLSMLSHSLRREGPSSWECMDLTRRPRELVDVLVGKFFDFDFSEDILEAVDSSQPTSKRRCTGLT